LGAIEMKALPDLIVTVRGLDRNNDVDPVVKALRILLQKNNIPFKDAADEFVDMRGLTKKDVEFYQLPFGSEGTPMFGRVLVIPNPRYEVVEQLFNYYSNLRRANRIEMRTSFEGTQGIRYILGYPDGRPRLVVDWKSKQTVPVDRDRFNGALRHLMGIYMVS
jgi:hypothetical protein